MRDHTGRCNHFNAGILATGFFHDPAKDAEFKNSGYYGGYGRILGRYLCLPRLNGDELTFCQFHEVIFVINAKIGEFVRYGLSFVLHACGNKPLANRSRKMIVRQLPNIPPIIFFFCQVSSIH